jgi:cell division protein FtsB
MPVRSGHRSNAAARVRWDRVGRVAMALVAIALFYLYVSAGVRMLSTIGQARSDSGAVAALQRENVLLTREHAALGRRNTLEEEARRLGMSKKDEIQYLVSGLPDN